MTPDEIAVSLTYDQAVALLPDGDEIHTFVDGGSALIGADWPRDLILDLLRDGHPQLSGRSATASGHGIVAFRPDDTGHVFIATKRDPS